MAYPKGHPTVYLFSSLFGITWKDMIANSLAKILYGIMIAHSMHLSFHLMGNIVLMCVSCNVWTY